MRMTNISWCINPGSSTSGQAWNPIRAEDRGAGRLLDGREHLDVPE